MVSVCQEHVIDDGSRTGSGNVSVLKQVPHRLFSSK